MARRYPCPQCGREMLLERIHEGFEVPCPACGHRFLVPIGAVGDAATVAATPAAVAPVIAAAEPVRTLPPAIPGRIPEPLRSTGGAVDDGTTAMVVGILGLVVCPLLPPVAWILGHKVRAEARRMGREPPGQATAGWILGIVGTVLALLIGCIYAAVIAFMIQASN